MGLMARLTGRGVTHGASGAPLPPPSRSSLVTAPTVAVPSTWLQPPAFRQGGYLVDIVGESHYQEALEAASGGRTSEGAKVPLVTAQLVREASNRYDANAVRVDLGGHTVGYLSREHAPVFHPMLAELAAGDEPATCRAWLTGGWWRGALDVGHFGLCLDLHPELHVISTPLLMPFGGRVSVTGEEAVQDKLLTLLDGDERREKVATLHLADSVVAVNIGDETVGRLTPKMSERYRPWVIEVLDAGFDDATCEARVVRGDNKVEVYVRLAKPWPTTEPKEWLRGPAYDRPRY